MITAIIIFLAYVANVILNRWLNKVLCDIDHHNPRLWGIWFIPFASTLAYLILICMEIDIDNWFTGKHWKERE